MLSLAVLEKGKPEIFYTLQGEGVSQGIPAVFIRLSFCNLYCHWCDTPYTWRFNDNHQHDWNKVYEPNQEVIKLHSDIVLKEVMKFPHWAHIIITGGEPLLQDKALVEVCKCLNGRWIEIETNGTRIPLHCGAYVSQYNVSPKLASSGNPKDKRDNEEAMMFFAQSYKSWFKFVVVSQDDLSEVMELQKKYQLPQDRMILMPEGTTTDELKTKASWLSEICKERGFRFSTRLQIALYGSKKGT